MKLSGRSGFSLILCYSNLFIAKQLYGMGKNVLRIPLGHHGPYIQSGMVDSQVDPNSM